jgi:hypothetical protein
MASKEGCFGALWEWHVRGNSQSAGPTQDPARRFGIFRLVTPSGLRMIQRCRERGFHPHSMADGGEIYEHSSHVLLDERLQWDLADLRD